MQSKKPKTNKRLTSIIFAFILLASVLPLGIVTAGTPTAEQVNDYSLEVANLVKEKCNGECKNVVLLGDDYVIPSFRRDIKWLNWYYFLPWLPDSKVDKILTDIGYVQRSEMEFSNLYALVTRQLDGTNFEGKNFLLILPNSLSTEQRRAVNDLKSEFETKFKSHFSEKKSSEVYCNDPQLWNNMNGYTLMVIGTEENNQAYNCFPFQAGLENRDAAFIDINPWDGRNYAVIFNTEDPLIIDTFTLFIHNETFKGIRSETAYFMKIGAKVAVYGAITLAVLSGVGAAAGFAGAGALVVTANVVNVAAGAAVVTDSCYYDSYKYGESWGGCVKDGIIVIVLPKVLEKATKLAVSKAIAYFKYTDETYPTLSKTIENFLTKFGLKKGTIGIKVEENLVDPETGKLIKAYFDPKTNTITLTKGLDNIELYYQILPHEYAHAKVFYEVGDITRLVNGMSPANAKLAIGEFEEFLAQNLAKDKLGADFVLNKLTDANIKTGAGDTVAKYLALAKKYDSIEYGSIEYKRIINLLGQRNDGSKIIHLSETFLANSNLASLKNNQDIITKIAKEAEQFIYD